MKPNALLSVLLITGSLLISSTTGWSQQRGKEESPRKAPAYSVKPAPKQNQPVKKAAPKPAPKTAHRSGAREHFAVRKGKWNGTTLRALPIYRNHSAFDRLPVEVAVQIELESLGYYNGPIDGDIGRGSIRAITNYQRSNGLVATGNIDRALLKSLNIID